MQNLQQKNRATRTRTTACEALLKLNNVLDRRTDAEDVAVVVEGPDETIRLPRDVAHLLREILVNTAAGRSVGVISQSEEAPVLTTQQAADLLDVSRPYVAKLVDEGILEGYKTGSHRRVYVSSVQKFKQQRDKQRTAADNLAVLSDELGLYE